MFQNRFINNSTFLLFLSLSDFMMNVLSGEAKAFMFRVCFLGGGEKKNAILVKQNTILVHNRGWGETPGFVSFKDEGKKTEEENRHKKETKLWADSEKKEENRRNETQKLIERT